MPKPGLQCRCGHPATWLVSPKTAGQTLYVCEKHLNAALLSSQGIGCELGLEAYEYRQKMDAKMRLRLGPMPKLRH